MYALLHYTPPHKHDKNNKLLPSKFLKVLIHHTVRENT